MSTMYNITNYSDSYFIGVEKADPNAQRTFSFFSATTNAVKYFDDDFRARCQNVTHAVTHSPFRTTLTGTMIFNPLISSSITCYPIFYQSYYISEIVNGPRPGVIFQCESRMTVLVKS